MSARPAVIVSSWADGLTVFEGGARPRIIRPVTPSKTTLGRLKTLIPPSRPRAISTMALLRPGLVIEMVWASPLPNCVSARATSGMIGTIAAGRPGPTSGVAGL